MNIQQLQYVMAVAETRHFESASQKCFITQSTLSTMISRFEDEMGIVIFDRKKRPVELTAEGEAILEQIKLVLMELDHLKELTKEMKGEVTGSLSISVIPTIAPYLLPLFIQQFATKYPLLNIKVKEQTTAEIVRQLKSRELDIGIISIPVKEPDLTEIKLYDEPFVFYDASETGEDAVSVERLNVNNLCLLEEGHCMRTQIISLCESHKKRLSSKLNFQYEAGSMDSLLRFVKANEATTLLPYLSTVDFSPEENRHLSRFADPVPYRTVGIVVHRHFVKKKLLKLLQDELVLKVKTILPNTEMLGQNLSPI